MRGNSAPWGLRLQLKCVSFQSNVCKVNGLLNKLSIVPLLGLFFLPARLHKSSIFFFFSQPWKILLHAGKASLALRSPTSNSILCQTADLKIDPIWSCRFPFKSTPTTQQTEAWEGPLRPGNGKEAMTLYYDRLWGCKVTNVRRRGSYILLSHSNIHSAVGLSA